MTITRLLAAPVRGFDGGLTTSVAAIDHLPDSDRPRTSIHTEDLRFRTARDASSPSTHRPTQAD